MLMKSYALEENIDSVGRLNLVPDLEFVQLGINKLHELQVLKIFLLMLEDNGILVLVRNVGPGRFLNCLENTINRFRNLDIDFKDFVPELFDDVLLHTDLDESAKLMFMYRFNQLFMRQKFDYFSSDLFSFNSLDNSFVDSLRSILSEYFALETSQSLFAYIDELSKGVKRNLIEDSNRTLLEIFTNIISVREELTPFLQPVTLKDLSNGLGSKNDSVLLNIDEVPVLQNLGVARERLLKFLIHLKSI